MARIVRTPHSRSYVNPNQKTFPKSFAELARKKELDPVFTEIPEVSLMAQLEKNFRKVP